jgi:hypothetical protein
VVFAIIAQSPVAAPGGVVKSRPVGGAADEDVAMMAVGAEEESAPRWTKRLDQKAPWTSDTFFHVRPRSAERNTALRADWCSVLLGPKWSWEAT